jgi:CRP-like cAMP-binding protein
MRKAKRAPTLTAVAGVLDWTGVRTQRVEYEPAAVIVAQGNPATSVMYVERGAVRLSVVSHAGKEAVVALLEPGQSVARCPSNSRSLARVVREIRRTIDP